jgi:hypothetical protein
MVEKHKFKMELGAEGSCNMNGVAYMPPAHGKSQEEKAE